jgi:hypothetical protein
MEAMGHKDFNAGTENVVAGSLQSARIDHKIECAQPVG